MSRDFLGTGGPTSGVSQPVNAQTFEPGQSPGPSQAKLTVGTMPHILILPAVGQDIAFQGGQLQGIVEFMISEKSGVGSDPRAVELKRQSAVKTRVEVGCDPIHPLSSISEPPSTSLSPVTPSIESAFKRLIAEVHLGNAGSKCLIQKFVRHNSVLPIAAWGFGCVR